MLRDARTSSPRRLSISEVRLSTGKKCSEINHRYPSPRALPAPGEWGEEESELGSWGGGTACADPRVGPSALTTRAFCLGGKPTAGSKGAVPQGFLQAPCFSPCISCTGTQHLSARDPLVPHTFACAGHIEKEMGGTEQHIPPQTHPLVWPGAEARAQPGFAPCLLPFPIPGLNLS